MLGKIIYAGKINDVIGAIIVKKCECKIAGVEPTVMNTLEVRHVLPNQDTTDYLWA